MSKKNPEHYEHDNLDPFRPIFQAINIAKYIGISPRHFYRINKKMQSYGCMFKMPRFGLMTTPFLINLFFVIAEREDDLYYTNPGEKEKRFLSVITKPAFMTKPKKKEKKDE